MELIPNQIITMLLNNQWSKINESMFIASVEMIRISSFLTYYARSELHCECSIPSQI